RLQRDVRSMMTLRGRSTFRLCHPVSALADEDRENRRRQASGRELRLGRAKDLEKPLVLVEAEPHCETPQKWMEKPAAPGKLATPCELPAGERQNFFAPRGLGWRLARQPCRVRTLATPRDVSRLRVATDVLRQEAKITVDHLPGLLGVPKAR